MHAWRHDFGHGPAVFAHRGASAHRAEHTLAAYERALEVGADGLECDVRLTADGHLVLVHDRRTGELRTMDNAECGFTYRDSVFKGESRYLVCEVVFALHRSELSRPIAYAEVARTMGVDAGDRVPLERMVHLNTRRNAAHVGWFDRGLLRPGYLADLNVIDLDRLGCRPPRVVHDLPAGGRRLVQAAEGYRFTVKSGTVTFEDGHATGEVPGTLVRGGRSDPAG